MEPTYKVLLFSDNDETQNKLIGLDAQQFQLNRIDHLPTKMESIETNVHLVIIEVNETIKFKEYFGHFKSIPVLLLLSEKQSAAMAKINSSSIDFVVYPYKISEISIRAKKLIQHFNHKIVSLQTHINNKNFNALLSQNDNSAYVIEVVKSGYFRFLGINKKLEKVSGISANQVKGKMLDDLGLQLSHKAIQRIKENLVLCCQQKKPVLQLAFTKTNHEVVHWQTKLIPIINEENQVTHIVGHSFDNSLLKAFNEIIVEQESFFHALFDASRDAIMVLDTEGVFIDGNRRLLNFFGVQHKNFFAKKSLSDLSPTIQPDGENSSLKLKNALKELKDSYRSKWILQKQNGATFTVELQFSVVNLDFGIHVLAIIRDVTKQEKTKQALAQSEFQFKKLFKQMNDGFALCEIIWDDNQEPIDYIFSDINQSFSELLERKENEIVNYSAQLIIPSFYLANKEGFRDIAVNGTNLKLEYYSEVLKKYFRITSYYTGNNKIATHISDVTQQKLLAQQLINDNENLQGELHKLTVALNESPVAIIITNESNEITYVNDSFKSLTGFSLTDAKGLIPRNILRFNNRTPEDQQKINNILKVGKTWSGELKSMRKNGERFWNYTHIIPTLNEQGKIVSRVILMEDFTIQKKTEEILRKNQKQLKTIFEFSPIGMAFINAGNTIVRANEQLAEILGLTVAEITGKDAFAIINNDDFITTLKKARNGQPASFKGDYSLSKKKSIYIKAEINPIYPGQIPSDVVVIVTDITDEKKKESTLEQAKNNAESANEAKSSFLANMSHEIRTPMNAVLGFAELLKKSITDPLLAGYTHSIINSGNTLLHIINDVLDMSKIEAGMLSVHNEPVKLKSLLTELESIFEIKVKEKKLLYFSHVDEKLPDYLMLDDLRVRQILLNLVNNAVKFTSSGFVKLITSTIFNADNTVNVEIKISDTGKGIKEQNLDKIFEAFNQQDNTFTKQFGGTGLGLTISRKLADLLGGELSVVSTENVGSTFTLTLTRVEICEESNLKKEEFNTDALQFDDSNVLVVDHNPLNLEILHKLLQPRTKSIRSSISAEEAIKMCQVELPDLILMDRRMNVNEAQNPAKIIKEKCGGKKIPIIALTASIFLDKQKDVYDLGFDDFIRRPVNEKELLMILMKYLGQKTAETIEKLPEIYLQITDKVLLKSIRSHVAKFLLPAIQQLNQNQSMRAVNALANTLIKTDKQFDIDAFKIYGKSLQLLSLNFDVAEIRNKLVELNALFTEFVEQTYERNTSIEKK